MRRFLLAIQLAAAVAILGYLGYHFFLAPRPRLDYDPSTWNAWNGFYAVSYPGVSSEEASNYISRDKLGEHLRALKEAGFRGIAPEDIEAFLQGRRPLPAKGLLLLFEGGRKDSYLYATPLLEKFGFLATMAVPTAFVHTWDTFYLKESDLKKMARSPYWRLGSMGHEAYRQIAVDPRGTQGHFLTGRWTTAQGREDDARFRERVTRDYRQAAGILSKATGKPALLYLYPFADPGSGSRADPLAAAVNRQALASFHSLSFVSAGNPFNHPGLDPLTLTRLRVSPVWTGKRLVEELERYSPRELPVSDLQDPNIWSTDRPLILKGGALIIQPETTLWLRGTETWADLEADFNVQMDAEGFLSFYLRYGGPQTHLRLSLSPEGIRFQEKTKSFTQTLAHFPTAGRAKPARHLRIRLKNNRAWLWIDGVQAPGPLPLSGTVKPGTIGFSGQKTAVSLLAFTARRLGGLYAFADRYRDLPPNLRADVRAVLTDWDVSEAAAFWNEDRRRDLLVSASEGVQTVPVLRLPAGWPDREQETAVRHLVRSLEQPLVKPFIKTVALAGDHRRLIGLLQSLGLRVVSLLTPPQTIAYLSAPSGTPADALLIEGPEQETRKALTSLLHVFPAQRTIVSLAAVGPVPYGVSVAVHPRTFHKGESK